MDSVARLTGLMGFEAATLWVASMVHLLAVADPDSGSLAAGVAEAVICLVLIAGAVALSRRSRRGIRFALGTVGFAIFGFLVGLTATVRGGEPLNLAYHATMLPLLVATAVLLARKTRFLVEGDR